MSIGNNNFDYYKDLIEGPTTFPTSGNDANSNYRDDRYEARMNGISDVGTSEDLEKTGPKHRAEVGEQTLSDKLQIGKIVVSKTVGRHL